MNLSKHGLSRAGKAGIVVVVIVLVLGAVYLVPSLTKGGVQSTATEGPSPTTLSLLSLFGYFPKMNMTIYTNDVADGITQNASYTYSVLGKAFLNTTQYLTVEFKTIGAGLPNNNEVIAYFNSTGGIPFVDVVGVRNYTGAGSYFFAQDYTTAYGLIPMITDNDTILSLLTKTYSIITNIGPTQMNVTAYSLAVPTSGYESLTVKYATIPGTEILMPVYVSEKDTLGSTVLIQVTSLIK